MPSPAALLRLFFDARLTERATHTTLTDPTLLARCHGAKDETDFEDNPNIVAPPAIQQRIDAVLQFNATDNTLRVVIDIPFSTVPTREQANQVAGAVTEAMYSGWGMNYEFELPPELNAYRFSFGPEIVAAQVVGAPRS